MLLIVLGVVELGLFGGGAIGSHGRREKMRSGKSESGSHGRESGRREKGDDKM